MCTFFVRTTLKNFKRRIDNRLTVLLEVLAFFTGEAAVEALLLICSLDVAATGLDEASTSAEAKWPCDELREEVRLDIGELLPILFKDELDLSSSPPPRLLSRPLSLSKRRTIEATLRGCVFLTSASSEDFFLPTTGLFEAEGIFSIKSFGNL